MCSIPHCPAEVVYRILHYLHVIDVSRLCDAVQWDKRLSYVVGLPCATVLQPINDISRRRCRYEKLFGKAYDTVMIAGEEVWEAGWTYELLYWRLIGKQLVSRQVRHEHAVAYLHLNETLDWLPPVTKAEHSSEAHCDTLTSVEQNHIYKDTKQRDIILPASFFKLLSDARLMQRLPYCFRLSQRRQLKKAADLVENAGEGYMIDFCYELDNGRPACIWSLYLEPGSSASHCVVSRPLRSDTRRITGQSSATLGGISFELWLANMFFSHWMGCGIEPCSSAHMALDPALSASLRCYVSYNCVP
jgi:hypothetical protein